MRIGLTYDLRDDYLKMGYSAEETAELDKLETIDGIDAALRELGFQTDRIGNARALVGRLANGDRWDLVFNIAEGLHGLAREAQVPAILDAFEQPYTFSDPYALTISLQKTVTKMLVRQAGVATPDFCEIRDPADLDRVTLPYPLFAKPAAEGSGKGISDLSRADTPEQLRKVVCELLETYRQPVLVETYLPGREFTVGVGGTGQSARVLGAMEVHFKRRDAAIYSYQTKTDWEDLCEYTPVSGDEAEPLAALTLAAWRALGCRDGGRIDVRLAADGQPHFIEVNPLPGLNSYYSDLPMLCRMNGISYTALIEIIVQSATDRYGLKA